MSIIKAEVLAHPATADDEIEPEKETISLWSNELPTPHSNAYRATWADSTEPHHDYRAQMHVLIDALFDSDSRLAEGHWYKIEIVG
jgi:hypothetical protein